MSIPSCLDAVSLPKKLPPLVLIAFNRPDLLQRILPAVQEQSLLPEKIIAFVDGPRNSQDEPLVKACLSLIRDYARVLPIETRQRPCNFGCDRNILSAFDEVLQEHEYLVYLEDDILPNSCFYERMCKLLVAYRHQPQVFSVSAYANVPQGFDQIIKSDFMVSQRVFCWGMGLWAQPWQKLAISKYSGQYNPFGAFYRVPANIQTKLTMINQYWLEKNKQTDWNITFTLATLYHQGVHITPMVSFIRNIGFGHSQAKTYKKSEPAWVNCAYDAHFYPNTLPPTLELPMPLRSELSGLELLNYLQKNKVDLDWSALLYFLGKYRDLETQSFLMKYFSSTISRLVMRKIPIAPPKGYCDHS